MVVRPLSLAFTLAIGIVPCVGQTSQPTTFNAAQSVFTEARALCDADANKLWGISLCGPILLVNPDSRALVGNQPDALGALNLRDGVYVGFLPKSENFANAAADWSGTHWTEMIWPLPSERSRRDTLIMHELFHRVQDKLPFAPMRNASNAHLDTLEGRYTMLLEYRALARALNASDPVERRAAVADALLFRAYRYSLFPKAADDEKSLEMNEGLAEYTGVRLGNPNPTEAQTAALRDLANQASVPTLVRSFAYATGPAYGLLLDRYRVAWRSALLTGQTLPDLLRSALELSTPTDLEEAVKQQSKRYDGVALYASESARETKRQAMLTLYRAHFIEGPTLSIPLRKMSVQFDPRTLQPLDDIGTVYPNIRISDAWGILEASNGALVKAEWDCVVLSAPTDISATRINGDGWTLELRPGWELIPGKRKGDYLVQPAP